MANEFKIKNGLISDGDVVVTGSITATGGINIPGAIASAETASFAPSYTLTSSFNSYTSSASSSLGELSGSVGTTTSGLAGRITTIEGRYVTTGSNVFVGDQVVTGSICTNNSIVTTGQIVAQTINVQQVTSSIVYSCGSNTFGCSLSNNQVFTGSVFITGSNINASVSNTCFGGTVTIGGGNDLIFRDTSSYISSPTTDTLRMVTSNSERLRVTSTGISCFSCRICAHGISSSNGVDVSGNIYFSGNINTGGLGARLWVPGQAIGQTNYSGLYAMALTYLAKYESGWKSVGGGYASSITIDEGIFSFNNSQGVGTENTTLNWTTRLTVNTDGNVGIGTVCPSNKLDVNGTLSTSGIIPYGTTYKTSNFLDFYPGNDNVLFFHAGTSWGDPLIAVNGTTAGSVLTNSLEQQLVIRGDGTNGIGFSNGSCINMIIKGGCVAIGTTTPATSLHISNNSNAGLRIQSTASNGSSELDLLSHGTQNSFIDFGPNKLIFRSTNCDMTVINDGNVLVLNNNGCVGVNTSTPRSVLHVQQSSNDGVPAVGCARDGLIISSNNGNYGLNIGIDPTGPAWMQSMRFDDGATAYNLLLQPAGGCSVLIGTGTALSGCRQQLVIGGNSFGSLIALGNNGNGNKFVIESDSSENVLINNKSNTPMIFYTNGCRRMDILGNGCVGIGCTSPGAQLVVYGACNGDTTLHVQSGTVSGKMSFSNNTANSIYGGGWWGYMGYSSATYHYFGQCIVAPKLEILRSSANNGLFVYSNSGATAIGCTMAQINGLTNDSTGNILTLASLNDGIRMVVRNDGNIGIGTASPTAPLVLATPGSTVDGTFFSTFTINNTGTSTWSRIRFDRSGVARWGIGMGTDDKFRLTNMYLNNTVTADDNLFVISCDNTITINGNFLPYSNGSLNLGSSSLRWGTVYTSDLSLSNGIGDYTIVEGENDLFLYNNKQCKVYRFMLEQVCAECATPKKS